MAFNDYINNILNKENPHGIKKSKTFLFNVISKKNLEDVLKDYHN